MPETLRPFQKIVRCPVIRTEFAEFCAILHAAVPKNYLQKWHSRGQTSLTRHERSSGNTQDQAPTKNWNSTVAKQKNDGSEPITIKKYANRRLYNTATSSYVTLDTLSQMVKEGVEFQVFDAKSGEDITKSVLTQIIFEEEAKGQNLLPIQFLRQVIRFYGDSMQAFVPSYLEMSMDSFAEKQEEMRTRLEDTFGSNQAYKRFEDQITKNIAMFQETMRMFTPFSNLGTEGEGEKSDPKESADTAELDELKAQLKDIREQLSKMSDKN
ncbi:MAG: polyhydroxyalkanoate synthesis repressor PhaR [Alphaproteobacteria bacterium]|nr:MAG: polyhydroxyalkanoate synthesis repressor PhaR [Alphaproteobacteria bacterium]